MNDNYSDKLSIDQEEAIDKILRWYDIDNINCSNDIINNNIFWLDGISGGGSAKTTTAKILCKILYDRYKNINIKYLRISNINNNNNNNFNILEESLYKFLYINKKYNNNEYYYNNIDLIIVDDANTINKKYTKDLVNIIRQNKKIFKNTKLLFVGDIYGIRSIKTYNPYIDEFNNITINNRDNYYKLGSNNNNNNKNKILNILYNAIESGINKFNDENNNDFYYNKFKDIINNNKYIKIITENNSINNDNDNIIETLNINDESISIDTEEFLDYINKLELITNTNKQRIILGNIKHNYIEKRNYNNNIKIYYKVIANYNNKNIKIKKGSIVEIINIYDNINIQQDDLFNNDNDNDKIINNNKKYNIKNALIKVNDKTIKLKIIIEDDKNMSLADDSFNRKINRNILLLKKNGISTTYETINKMYNNVIFISKTHIKHTSLRNLYHVLSRCRNKFTYMHIIN